MAYQIIHLENLTELKSRVGGTTTPTLATILGIDYPNTEAFSVYLWDNNSNSTPDDYEVVRPNPRATLPGRWYRVELDVSPHTHPINQIEGLRNELDSPIDYEDLENIPTTFNPIAHSHTISDIGGLATALNEKQPVGNYLLTETDPTVPTHVKNISLTNISNWNTAFGWGNHTGLYKLSNYVPNWNEITNKPTSFTPSSHTHTISEIASLQTALDSKINNGAAIPYSTITGTPTIPAAQINSDWNSNSGVSQILNKPTIPPTISLTTTGIGNATLTSGVLNIPNPSNMFVVNNATVGLSRATLNSTYPNTPVGYMVLCPSIILGGAVYVRTTTGASGIWQLISAPPVS